MEDCAAILRNSGQWDDFICSGDMGVVCEKPLDVQKDARAQEDNISNSVALE